MSEETKTVFVNEEPITLTKKGAASYLVTLTKKAAASYLSSVGYSDSDRLVLIQKTLNDIEERLARIEKKLDK